MEYNPNDFSQAAINSGQRKINYALTVVDEKLAKALQALCDALAALPPTHNIDLKNVNEALKEFRYLSAMVAGIKPPGCDPEWPAQLAYSAAADLPFADYRYVTDFSSALTRYLLVVG